MAYTPITKTATVVARANLSDYRWVRHDFTWSAAKRWLAGRPDGQGLNIGRETVDRHVQDGRAEAVALRCLDRRGGHRDVTYGELMRQTNRFANALAALGVAPGERVFALLDPGPELYVAALGTLKYTAVLSPLSCALAPEQIRRRMVLGDATTLVTTADLYERKVAPVRAEMPALRHVLVEGDRPPAGSISLEQATAAADDRFTVPPTGAQQTAMLQFTRGTTGAPKGVFHAHEAVAAHHATALYALDLRPDDVFWCTADPGEMTGTSYGIIAPLTHGVTVLVDAGDLDADRWHTNVSRHRVTVCYTSPSTVRTLMRHGTEPAARRDPSALRFIASGGEPLGPEAVLWGTRALGQPVHDTWWQTETGAIMISNFAGVDIRPGAMGLPVPGVEVGLLHPEGGGRPRVRDGAVTVIDRPDAVGELALRSGWPSMFRGYLHDDARYEQCFADGWYRTGDLASRDSDGYYWFAGRIDAAIGLPTPSTLEAPP
ncbi:AMP-binding protein [Dactylosporangium sp. NPDC005555]|uniref:AMP-binding protein n=1 Tax=Dactylosporangium sp. NPDC005555 TaxID=3154889 RepID=UPI0033B2F7D6